MPRKIIAIGHQKNVGKDEFIKFCIDILRTKHRGLKIVRRGFADKLYDMLHQLYGWAGFQPRTYYAAHPHAKANMIVPLGKTVRDLLIEWGQHMRKLDGDIWINANLKTQDSDILFVSDMRFPNEFLHVQANSGLTVRLSRPGLPVPTDEADTALNGWDNRWDIHLENNGSLNDLHALAEEFVSKYLQV